jgi:hypothetical protein
MHFSDDDLDDLEEMAVLLEEMSPDELEDFIKLAYAVGDAKKSGSIIFNNSEYIQ